MQRNPSYSFRKRKKMKLWRQLTIVILKISVRCIYNKSGHAQGNARPFQSHKLTKLGSLFKQASTNSLRGLL